MSAHLSGSAGEESACNAGDTGDAGSIPESGRFPGGGNDSPSQYSCLKNPMDRGAWWATRTHTHAHTYTLLISNHQPTLYPVTQNG